MLGACAVLLVLLSGFALLVNNSQRDAHQALTDRFAVRTNLTASFVRNYVNDIANRERSQAQRLLSGRQVDQATFEQVTRSFDFDAVVLLDQQGRLLNVWPPKPALVGTDMTVKYKHLRTAVVDGKIGVSAVVPSAAKRLPVTAVAVPFDTPSGRRVLSGAFSPATSPLGAYFTSVISSGGGNVVLIDDHDQVLASAHGNEPSVGVRPKVHDGVDQVDADGTRLATAVAQVPDTPWRVVLTVPTATLYAPVSQGRWAPWSLWAAFAGAGVTILILFVRLNRARATASSNASTDSLTGLPNRRAMEEMLAKQAWYSTRHNLPLVALMVDLDHFKQINDSAGHHGGDLVLRASATRAREAVRTEDIVGRWGGEEFLVLLPHTDVLGGWRVAERVRAAIATRDGSDTAAVTASIGLAVLESGADALLRDADAALYEAKTAGRNRTVVAATSRDPSAPEPVAVASLRRLPEPSPMLRDSASSTDTGGVLVVPRIG